MKRLIPLLGVLALALAGLVAVAPPGSAHTGDLKVKAVCNVGTGNYDLTAKLAITQSNLTGNYKWRVGTSTFQGTPNNDNGMGPATAFPGPGTYTLTTFSLPGTTTGFGPWVYAFTKWSDNFTKGSDGQLLDALKGDCKKPDAKDASASVSVTPATCDAPALLVYGSISNATFSGTPDGTKGPGPYSVTATAEPGHRFSDDSKSQTFDGTLDGVKTTPECFTDILGGVQKVDKCGTKGDLFRLRSVTGGQYEVNGKVRAEGKWLRANARRLGITLKPSSPKYVVDGRSTWVLKFTNRACPTPPHHTPHTGARTVA